MNRLMIRHTMDKPLPYDAEVEYIESTGTQYINTGITCNTDTDVLRVAFSISSFVSFCGVAGCRVGASDHNFAIGYNNNNAMSADCNNSNYANSRAQISDAVANTDYTIIISRQGRYIYKGDSLVDSNTSTSDIFTTGDVYIFAVNGIQNYSQIRVKSAQIERNGEEYMTLIPVRKGNTGYLYDKVSGQLFGNQGTGNFVVGPDYNPFAYQYLTFVPLEDSTFSFSKRGTGNDIEYSIDGGTWTSLASEANTPTVAAGSKVIWRGNLRPNTTNSTDAGIGTFSSTANYYAKGNTMSLLYGDDFYAKQLSGNAFIHVFQRLFYNDTHILSAPLLPATTLNEYCYYQMFCGCTSLLTAPALPATALSGRCYVGMFFNCISLTTAPELPATTLAMDCYIQMFYGCTLLTTAPALPATTLAVTCYSQMFQGCTSLTTAPELPATTLKVYCYQQMFRGCTSLNYIKCLATDISATGCTNNWLNNVASTGTFVKAAGMEDWTTGASGIPSGWTVVDDPSTINS